MLFVLTCTHPCCIRSWKSTLIIALDACFKLKLKDRSFLDPDLGTGLTYMVNEEKYQRHLAHCSKNPPSREVSFRYTRVHINDDQPSPPAPYMRFNVTRRKRCTYQVLSWVPHYWGRHFILSTRSRSAQRCCGSPTW